MEEHDILTVVYTPPFVEASILVTGLSPQEGELSWLERLMITRARAIRGRLLIRHGTVAVCVCVGVHGTLALGG